MKLKDYVYDPDRKIAIVWLENIDHEEIEKLLSVFKAANPKPKDDFDYDKIIFSD